MRIPSIYVQGRKSRLLLDNTKILTERIICL